MWKAFTTLSCRYTWINANKYLFLVKTFFSIRGLFKAIVAAKIVNSKIVISIHVNTHFQLTNHHYVGG